MKLRLSKQTIIDNLEGFRAGLSSEAKWKLLTSAIQMAPAGSHFEIDMPAQGSFVEATQPPARQAEARLPTGEDFTFTEICSLYGLSSLTPRMHKDKLEPCGFRRTGGKGKPAHTFTAESVARLAAERKWQLVKHEPSLITPEIEKLASKFAKP